MKNKKQYQLEAPDRQDLLDEPDKVLLLEGAESDDGGIIRMLADDIRKSALPENNGEESEA